MLTKDDLQNILFFLGKATLSGQEAMTLAQLQVKIQ